MPVGMSQKPIIIIPEKQSSPRSRVGFLAVPLVPSSSLQLPFPQVTSPQATRNPFLFQILLFFSLSAPTISFFHRLPLFLSNSSKEKKKTSPLFPSFPSKLYSKYFFSVSIFSRKPPPAPLCTIPPMRHPPNHHHGRAMQPVLSIRRSPSKNARKRKENNSARALTTRPMLLVCLQKELPPPYFKKMKEFHSPGWS